MTASNCLYLFAFGVALFGWQYRVLADDDVTVVPAPSATPAQTQPAVAADGTPVIHKSAHKKKVSQTATANGATPATAPATSVLPASQPQAPPGEVVPLTRYAQSTAPPPHAPIIPVSTIGQQRVPPLFPAQPIKVSTVSIPVPTTATGPVHSPSLVPTVETGLPVAKYPGMDGPITGVSTYIPTPTPMPAKSITGTTTHPYYASIIPTSIPLTSSPNGYSNYVSPSRTTTPPSDFVFTNFSRRTTMTYPWKRDIITTMFWIGEGGSSISATDNIGSAWDENWRSHNRGNDDPEDRNGFASADHASTINPFYVALPFNDLAYPDKARYWVPRNWHRPNEDGKQVSACKDRWVCIKNANGRLCYAQWEDVGPLRSDHAEYVFGDERPDTYTRAGLDISPAVAQYLGIDGNRRAITSWRFVDEEDVPPGQWLKYDEQAVIFTAMHQLRSANVSDLPIQKAAEPIDDQNLESNKKKVDQSKG
jgi:hypothetical protein